MALLLTHWREHDRSLARTVPGPDQHTIDQFVGAEWQNPRYFAKSNGNSRIREPSTLYHDSARSRIGIVESTCAGANASPELGRQAASLVMTA